MSKKKHKLSNDLLEKIYEQHPTQLPQITVYPNRAATVLGTNSSYKDFVDWWRESKIQDAYDRALYSRAGFAPLETPSDWMEGEVKTEDPQIYADTIANRHASGFYDEHPAVLQSDSTLYKRRFRPISGYSCINSNTNYFGSQYANINNIDFAKRHFGFIPVDKHEMKKGDIVQLQKGWEYPDPDYQRPFHAVMFDSYNNDGTIKTIDQHGMPTYYNRPDIVDYDLEFNGIDANVLRAFRFIGSDQDINKDWTDYINFTSKIE